MTSVKTLSSLEAGYRPPDVMDFDLRRALARL